MSCLIRMSLYVWLPYAKSCERFLVPTVLFLAVQIGETVLRNFVFVHLEQPADKLQLLLAMMHKLYAMITRQCCDDNPDALIHHEVLFLPCTSCLM